MNDIFNKSFSLSKNAPNKKKGKEGESLKMKDCLFSNTVIHFKKA